MRQISHVWTNAIRATVALGAVAIISAQANAQSTIAYWNFDSLGTTPITAAVPGGNSVPLVFAADGEHCWDCSTLYSPGSYGKLRDRLYRLRDERNRDNGQYAHAQFYRHE